MKLPKLTYGKWNYLAMAFAIPAFFLLIAMMIAGCPPFGQFSWLYSDMYHQYFPFFKAFREALRSGESLLYTWDVGLGMDYLGLIAYYLASPLNLLSVILPESWLLPYFSLLTPLRLGLAGLFFALFLKKTFGRDDLSLPLFGSFYALCAWALGYHWNIMWVDGFMLLPLVVLGTLSLLKEKKFFLYTVTLFLSIFSNYYIGFFICIFVLLVFICYEICRCRSIKRFFADLGRMALVSALAVGMTAVLTLPTWDALQDTQSSINAFPEGFSMNIVAYEKCTAAREAWEAYRTAAESGQASLSLWFSALGKSFLPILQGMKEIAGNLNGGIEPTFKEGLPNLYCGMGTVFFALLFLTCKQIRLRDKLCAVALLLFFMLSFLLRQLDYIWHGFHFTNMMPYRFSFLFSFVMLYMAYRAFLLWRRIKLWQVLCAAAGAFAIILLYEDLLDPMYLICNGVFFLLYFGVCLYTSRKTPLPKDADKEVLQDYFLARKCRRSYASIVLAVIMSMELIMNVVNFGICFPQTYIADYPKGTEYTASMIRYMNEREEDNPFFRAEVTHSQTLNDGALNGYNGISAFTSSANVKVTEFMRSLGYAAKNTYNRYCFEESSPVSNLFLGLKYMLERDGRVEENPYFDTVHHYKDVYLLENNAYLPLGFLAETGLSELSFNSADTFFFQNALFSAATGLQENVWDTGSIAELTISSEYVDITNATPYGYCSYAATESAILKYTYTILSDGFLCIDLNLPKWNSFSVWKNGKELYSESVNLRQTLGVSQVAPGDVIEIQIVCGENESGTMTVRSGLLNDTVFRHGYEILNASTLQIESFHSDEILGTISCDRDGLLYTSIPQNGNWVVYVDAQRVETTTVGGVMLAIPLTEGTHTLYFRYKNNAHTLGAGISLACAAIFTGLSLRFYGHKLKRHRGKFEK